MKGSNSLMEWVVKLIFFLMLLPFFVSLGLQVLGTIGQMIAVFLWAILPWLIGLFALAVAAAGLAAARILRRRHSPRNRGDCLPPGMPRLRRPREVRRGDEDE
jgi:hypothetical protein